MQEAVEMQTENEEAPKSDETPIVENSERNSAESASSSEEFTSELKLSGWSIVTFEGVAVSGLDYEEATKWLRKLEEQKISGLCIVTDEAAERILK